MEPDLWALYREMLYSRLYEEAVMALWEEGLISGEMHLGLGEEGIVAGVMAHLAEEDALALDHRGTAAMLMRGVDPVLLMKELLGREDGLCRGRGGHMHLFSREHLSASSGIVGAAGPGATGLGLAAKRLRPRSVAVAFFGEGAMNQGMLLESLNLAVVWDLPVLFVCKDDRWAISTRSPEVTGGELVQRAQAFGLPSVSVDGQDVLAVWQAAEEAVARAREGEGPAFLHATCTHLEGHFLGDLLLRRARRETLPPVGSLLRSMTSRRGASLGERMRSLAGMTGLIRESAADHERQGNDPLSNARAQLEVEQLEALEATVSDEVQQVVATALG